MKELDLLQYLTITNSLLALFYLLLFIISGKLVCLALSFLCAGLTILSKLYIDEEDNEKVGFLSILTGLLTGILVLNIFDIKNDGEAFRLWQIVVIFITAALPPSIVLSLLPYDKNNLLTI